MATIATANASQVKDTQRAQTNQVVGKMVEASATNNTALLAALQAIVDAINAKPSA